MLRRLTMLCAALVVAAVLPAADADAQQNTQDELQKRYEAKIAEDWVSFGGWILDFDEARKEAADGNKLILLYCTRSYAP